MAAAAGTAQVFFSAARGSGSQIDSNGQWVCSRGEMALRLHRTRGLLGCGAVAVIVAMPRFRIPVHKPKRRFRVSGVGHGSRPGPRPLACLACYLSLWES